MSQFGLVIVGCGGISRAHLAAAKATNGRIAVKAVVDPSVEARESLARDASARAFASFDEFLGSDQANAVKGAVICTPPSLRIGIVSSALSRGMAVLVEKPITHTLSDARAMQALASGAPRVVSAVGYCHRFTPAMVEIKRRISAGQLGQVSRFENTFACPHPKMKAHWMSDRSVSGGGSFIDTGCHSLDLFHYLIGPGRVRSAVFHHAWAGRGESSATALLRSQEGVAGVIQSGWTEPGRFVVSVVGTQGSLTYDYDRATELRHRPNDGPEQRLEVESHEVRFQRQLEAFAESASGGRPEIEPATFADGLVVAGWVEQAGELARS